MPIGSSTNGEASGYLNGPGVSSPGVKAVTLPRLKQKTTELKIQRNVAAWWTSMSSRARRRKMLETFRKWYPKKDANVRFHLNVAWYGNTEAYLLTSILRQG